MILLKAENISKTYGEVEAVRSANVEVKRGEIFGIMGPSGSGKSTLLRILNLLERPTRGEVRFDGEIVSASDRDAFQWRRRMAMVLQKPEAMNRSVYDNITYGLELRGLEEDEQEKRAVRFLHLLGLDKVRNRNAHSLSGGELQRMCFARAAIVDPEIIFLDEFTANLDPSNVLILENAVRGMLQDGGKSAVIVTHNVFQARRLCDRVAVMVEGEIIEVAKTKQIFENAMDPRTRAFASGEMVY